MSVPRQTQGRARANKPKQSQKPVKKQSAQDKQRQTRQTQQARQTQRSRQTQESRKTGQTGKTGKGAQGQNARGKRRQGNIKLFRLFSIMICLFIGTFVLSSIVTGNPGRVAQIVQGLLTPAMPKLVLRDGRNEYRINPFSRKDARETRTFLQTNYEENQGIVALNTESSAVAGLQNQSPFQRHLTKMNYSPQTLSVNQFASQRIAFATPPTSMETLVFFLGGVYASNSLDDINDFLPDNDGLCYVLVDAIWESDKSWQADRNGVYCFAIMFDRPAIFSINTEDIDPGELLVFYAEYLVEGEPVTVQSKLPLNLQFTPYSGRHMIALAPISYDIRPDTYITTLSAGAASQTFEITVKDKEFAVQYVSIDPRIVAETRTEETNKEFQDKVNPILAEQSRTLLWRGKAALPVPESRVLTLFGSRRYVNDDVNSYRHTGLDLEAPLGTEIRAVNHGKVLFAEYLAYTGNTVLIEHGLGLKSWYYHMDELLVTPGDVVAKDDVIGLSGQTGFAAEPHLHLTLSVGNVYINPVTAINQALFSEPQ